MDEGARGLPLEVMDAPRIDEEEIRRMHGIFPAADGEGPFRFGVKDLHFIVPVRADGGFLIRGPVRAEGGSDPARQRIGLRERRRVHVVISFP